MEPLPIWPDRPPGTEHWTQVESQVRDPAGNRVIRNVTVPTLTPFAPDAALANGTAMVVAPGGGFRILSWDNEGTALAQWLATRGIAAYVLKYRLADTGPTEIDFAERMAQFSVLLADGIDGPIEDVVDTEGCVGHATADGVQAIKRVRELGFANGRVGMIGFSAGAMVTSGAAFSDDQDGRPDFIAPIYGAIGRLGEVGAAAPPMFSVVASDDRLAVPACLRLYNAWYVARRPAELHVYASGGHGFGMGKRGMAIDGWIDRLGEWLDGLGVLRR